MIVRLHPYNKQCTCARCVSVHKLFERMHQKCKALVAEREASRGKSKTKNS